MSFPVVPLESIPTQGLSVAVGEWAAAGCGEGLGGTATRVGGQLSLVRNGRSIVVRGTLEGVAESRCDRCGEPLVLSVSSEVACEYVPMDALAAARAEDDAPLPDDAPEQGEYDGVALDLVHVVRESFALERPARLLCGDLDPAADADCLARFRSKANLPSSEPDPRLAALKGVKPTR